MSSSTCSTTETELNHGGSSATLRRLHCLSGMVEAIALLILHFVPCCIFGRQFRWAAGKAGSCLFVAAFTHKDMHGLYTTAAVELIGLSGRSASIQ